jgi:hypothetical protein
VTGLLLFAAVFAQAIPPSSASNGTDLDRIRKALDRPPAITTEGGTDASGRPVFRMSVRAPGPEKPLWDAWTNVPSYIRPNMPGDHYYFLQMVTPEEFRAGTLYPMAIPVGPLLELIGRHLASPHRKSQQERARDEVRQALAELFACRSDAARPGC